MADLSPKLEMVLDKLYNLKGDDNIVIAKIKRDIEDTEAAIKKAEEDQKNNEINKDSSENKLSTFIKQKNEFEEMFSGLDDTTFEALKDIGINIEIGTMSESLSDKSPEYISSLEGEIQKYSNAIESLKNKKNDLTLRLADYEASKIKAETDQQRLISLLEQSLSNDTIERESLAVHHVKGILSSFDIFTDDELSKLSKLIIFPDEGLITYDKNYETRILNLNNEQESTKENYKEVSTFEQEDKEEHEELIDASYLEEVTKDEEKEVEEEIAYEDVPKEDIVEFKDENKENPLDMLNQQEELTESIFLATAKKEIEEERVEEPQGYYSQLEEEKEIKIENIEEYLESIGLSNESLKKGKTAKQISAAYDALSRTEKRIIAENYETLRSISIYDGYVLYQISDSGHMFLTDKELNKKLTLLRAKGISESKITDLVKNNRGLKETFEVLEKRVNAIEEVENKIDDDNIKNVNYDMAKYRDNLNELRENGIELDEKETLIHKSSILTRDIDIKAKSEILKNYLISMVRKNGKYALGLFAKDNNRLIQEIDALIENGLESILVSNPEILNYRIEPLIGRVKYCEENGIPVFTDGDKTKYCRYIVESYTFEEEFKNHGPLPKLVDAKETNTKLPGIIGNGDYVEILINTLDDYYNTSDNPSKIKLNSETMEELENLMTYFEERFNIETTGKNTYNINDICISKNKVERNLGVLLNSMKASNAITEGVENEILLTAALYNLQQKEDILRSVVGSCLGFNEENTLGGKRL